MPDKKIEDTIKELEPQFKALKAIFENPSVRNDYEKSILKETNIKREKEKKYLEEQRKKVERVDAAAGLQEKVYDLAQQMGIDKDDFKKRLESGEFDNILTYSCLQDYLPFFENKLWEKELNKRVFELDGKSIHLKYLKESTSVLKEFIDFLKKPYNLYHSYKDEWIKAGSDPDLGIEKIKEIYCTLDEMRFDKILVEKMSDMGTLSALEVYLSCRAQLPDIEANVLPKLRRKIKELENKKLTVIIERKKRSSKGKGYIDLAEGFEELTSKVMWGNKRYYSSCTLREVILKGGHQDRDSEFTRMLLDKKGVKYGWIKEVHAGSRIRALSHYIVNYAEIDSAIRSWVDLSHYLVGMESDKSIYDDIKALWFVSGNTHLNPELGERVNNIKKPFSPEGQYNHSHYCDHFDFIRKLTVGDFDSRYNL